MNQTLEWNANQLLESIGGDMDLLKTILEAYLTDTPKLIEDLATNLAGKNIDKAIRNAHSIKGSSGSIGAKTIYDLASICEKSLNESDSKAIDEQVVELTSMISTQLELIRSYITTH